MVLCCLPQPPLPRTILLQSQSVPRHSTEGSGTVSQGPTKAGCASFIRSLLSMGHPTVNRALSARTSGSCPVNAGWACLWGSHLTPAVLGVQGGSSGLGLPSASLCAPARALFLWGWSPDQPKQALYFYLNSSMTIPVAIKKSLEPSSRCLVL